MIFHLYSLLFFLNVSSAESKDYRQYHEQVLNIETLIVSEKYNEALQAYDEIFRNYNFIFLQEYKIATQLALYLNKKEKAKEYLRKGMLSGWKMKYIKKNKLLRSLREDDDWKSIKKEYHSLNDQFQARLNESLSKQVKKMFSRDQWKALGAFFKLSSDAQDRYAEKKFAPHSEKQMALLSEIFQSYGYPGEQLIGNKYWVSTIISHHNSISTEYGRKDTLYLKLRPALVEALKYGQISPFEFALIEDWRISTLDNGEPGYGILDAPKESELAAVNNNRKSVGLRTVEIRNKLVDIQNKTGINFYLQGNPWIDGKIEVKK